MFQRGIGKQNTFNLQKKEQKYIQIKRKKKPHSREK